MKTCLDCLPCFVDQALRTGRIAGADDGTLKRLLDAVGGMFREISLETSPPEVARMVYGKIREITGNEDPYAAIKAESTRRALAQEPLFREYIRDAEDPLLMAVRLAIAGNVIDFGVYGEVDLEREVARMITQEAAICDEDPFRDAVARAPNVLFIADNAGESVFDKLLIEEMGKPTTYAVRGMPIINDAVAADAVAAGVDRVAQIVSTGTDAPGAVLSTCTEAFREQFHSAPLIISKGQGNYEALSGETAPIFFLLKAKCRVIAEDIGVSTGDIVFQQGQKAEG